jgi:hypothetical protein
MGYQVSTTGYFGTKLVSIFTIQYFTVTTKKHYRPPKKCESLPLYTKQEDKQCLDNYRTLSLTNTDYKIIAFVFARRLQKIELELFHMTNLYT